MQYPNKTSPSSTHVGIAEGAQRVLSDTYRLLSWTLLFSAFTATLSATVLLPVTAALLTGMFGLFAFLGVYFALLFMVTRNAEKPSGVIWVFAVTGWLGLSLGPMLYVVVGLNGFAPIVNALATTGLIFLATSWAGRRFPGVLRMGRFIMIGILVAFVSSLVNILLFQSSAASLVISGIFAVLSSGLIAWQTAAIVHGGERNYILATVTLFVSIYNLFSILLSFIGFGDD